MQSPKTGATESISEGGKESRIQGDNDDIETMGYKAELQRKFGMWSMVGLSCTIMVTWEGLLFVFTYGLEDGGPAGLIYGFIFCWIGYTCVVASLAELVSMIPSAAGQYHWTWYLAPSRWKKFLGFITGWQLVIAWQADLASAVYLGGTIIQGLLVMNYPDYDAPRWQGTLLLYAVILVAAVFNTVLARWLPFVEGSILVIHIVGFFIVLVAVTYLGPHTSAENVFANFLTLGGYNPGLSFFIGLITTVFAFLGADGAIHMSEEVIDARRAVPKSLMTSIMVNGVLGFAMLFVILFCIGDIDAALSSPTGFPFMEIFQQALQSVRFATGLASLILTLLIFACVAVLAATSRVTFAFARDGGLPFSNLWKRVHPSSGLPLPAIGLSVVITMLLGLINIGSSTAFNAIISLVVAGYFGSYFIPIALIAWRRARHDPTLQYGPWRLGKWGLPVNSIALVWIVIIFFFSFWPTTTPITLTTMNWAVLLWCTAILVGGIYYMFRRTSFTGPKLEHEA